MSRDLRAALRAMSRKPGVTGLAVASLGLAIGFSTAAFSVLDAYSLRDLPVSEPARLAHIYAITREQRPDNLSWPEYQAMTARSRLFSGLITEARHGPRVKLPDRDDFPITAGVSENYFDVLGVRAARGDVFHPGTGRDETVVISNHYWQQALGGDPGIIGRSLPVGIALLKVIGVLPPGFTGTQRGLLVDLFVPPQTFFDSLGIARPDQLRFTDYEVTGRLRPGVSLLQARAELDGILRQVQADGRAPAPERKAAIEAFSESGIWAKLAHNVIPLATVLLLVLIAAANLANLRLVDNESRRHEVGIRLALGAGRADLARQHLVETLLLGGMGTAAGLLVAAWLIRLAPALFYGGRRYLDLGIRLDARTFAFSSGALFAVAVIGALIPLGDAWRRRIVPALHGTRSTRPSRWMTALVIAQMALVTGVTCSAALLWRSLQNISAIRPAMDPERKLLLIEGGWHAPDPSGRAAALAQGIAGLPGVERVGWARRAMLSGSGGGMTVDLEMPGQPKLSFPLNQVSPNYFAATGARVLAGRAFNESDGPDATPVTMVNSAFVRRFFPGRQPLGQWIKVGGKGRQIVGVVEDGPQNHLREAVAPYFYFPFAQMPSFEATLFVETGKDPGLLAGTVRDFIRGTDKAFVLLDVTTMRQHMRNARSEQLLEAGVSGGLAAVGLLLAAAGLFGVSLFAVARRTPEFGVRVAMGAAPPVLVRHVLKEAALRIAIAIPLGWALAYAGRGALGEMLYGIAPDDPWTLVAAGALVAVVGCVAALPPAIRAARIDPVVALRHE